MVESTGNKILLKVGSGRVYPFPVRFIDASDVHCFVNVNGVERELVASEFSVERKDDYSDGANVTLNIDPLPTGATLAIVRQCDPVQLVSFPINGKFPSKGNENALDKLTMIVQDLYERLNRAIAGSVTDSNAVISYDEFKKFLDQAVTDSASAKNLVEEWLKRFAGLTADSTGRLFWKGCEVLTRCNIGDIGGGGGSDGEDGSGGSGGSGGSDGSDGEDGDPGRPGEIIVVEVEGDTSKGRVIVERYNRRINLRFFHLNSAEQSSCKFDHYLTSVAFNWDKALAFSKFYGYLATTEGYEERWEDEDGNEVVECMDNDDGPYCKEGGGFAIYDYTNDVETDITFDATKVLSEISRDITAFISGELHYGGEPPASDYPFPASGWSGYKWYRLDGSNSSAYTMSEKGDTINPGIDISAGWYSNWGELPCGQSPEGTSLTINVDTVIFHWQPNEGYEGAAPLKVLLIDDKGERRAYDFDVEYCLTGMSYTRDLGWHEVVACSDDCKFPLLRCIVEKLTHMENEETYGSTPYYHPDATISPVFTYEGVLFGGEE